MPTFVECLENNKISNKYFFNNNRKQGERINPHAGEVIINYPQTINELYDPEAEAPAAEGAAPPPAADPDPDPEAAAVVAEAADPDPEAAAAAAAVAAPPRAAADKIKLKNILSRQLNRSRVNNNCINTLTPAGFPIPNHPDRLKNCNIFVFNFIAMGNKDAEKNNELSSHLDFYLGIPACNTLTFTFPMETCKTVIIALLGLNPLSRNLEA